jgi:O-antigen ligase
MKELDLDKTPQLFWTGFVFLVLTFVFPPLSWLFGLFALFILVPVTFGNPRYVFGMIWRMMLIALLIASGFALCLFSGEGNEYRSQFMIAGAIGFVLSASGLVRSFYLAHIRNNS